VILVTGATGTVGREVVRRLAAEGTPLRALVRDPARASAIRLPDVEIVAGDFADRGSLDDAMAGADRLFLLSPASPDQVELQTNVIEAAGRAGVARIVKVSVAGGPDAGTRIGRWHWEIEKRIEASGIPFTMLRPNLFMQQMLRFARAIARSGAFSLPAGTGEVSLIDARDVAAVAAAALTGEGHERRIYDLTGPEAISFDAVAAQLSDALGRPVAYVHVPPEYARRQLAGEGVPRWLVEDMLILFAAVREGYAAGVTDTVRAVTGHPARTFRQFAREHVDAFRPKAEEGS
jgi:uncharacterized protein YbjT (DUF2867 family)